MLFFITFLLSSCYTLHADDFFLIKSVKYYKESTLSGTTVIKKKIDQNGKIFNELQPFIEAKVSTNGRVRFDNIFAKIYFYAPNKKLIASLSAPSIASRSENGSYDIPAFFEKEKTESIFFEIPESIRGIKGWTSIVVFGDYKEIAVSSYPESKISEYNFAEKYILSKNEKTKRTDTVNPLIYYTVRNSTDKQPKITLFLLPPPNKRVDGLFAVCLLANSLENIKKNMLNPVRGSELYEIMDFANKHNLAVLCWGSKSLWNRSKNWTEQNKQEYKDYDKTFDTIASSWSYGVNQLCEKYKIPSNNILLWGTSGAAQYAMRLALRCPEKFLAVALHIPSSFDKPTANGKNILWCLTTGELESGYNRSLEFYKECVLTYEYPIIYKAVVGLGHRSSRLSTNLRLTVLEYALNNSEKIKRETWREILMKSEYYGDIINQQTIKRSESVVRTLSTPLPNLNIRTIWEESK